MDNENAINIMGLEKLIKALKNPPVIRIGILAGKDGRKAKGESNATIGAKHEFGADGMPRRSFLRMPLSENLQSYLEKTNALNKEVFKKVFKNGSLEEWATQVGFVAETVVLDAFDSGGFGKWPKWRGGYKSRTGMILVDTTQLRNSITSEVKK